jgi:hypothetical protein
MNRTARWLGALCVVAFLPALAHAQHGRFPGYPPPPRIAPDACGPAIYWPCPDGTYLGPSYYLRPPFEPFQGFRPTMQRGPNGALVPVSPFGQGQGQGQSPVFPTHPYARSPRDFFMWGEAQQDLHTRERRPPLAP